MNGVGWARYEGRALASVALRAAALHAELEDAIRVQNPDLTDVRLEGATATEEYERSGRSPKRWYDVTYLADDGLAR
jgi:hypothetical protein